MAEPLPFTDHSDQVLATERATELARRQSWAIARHQLVTLGLTEAKIRSWLRSGRLHRSYPGVYAWGRAELGVPGELGAALLYAGSGSALGGLSGLWWLGLLNRRPGLVHIDAPGRVRSRPGIRIRHPARIERTWHRDLPVAAMPELLLAAASCLSHNALRLVLGRAEFAGVLDISLLHGSLGRGRTGAAALRVALASHLPALARCANRFEREFVLLCERCHLPIPEPNSRIGRYRPDMLWRDVRLIVELDGRDAHSTPAQLASDARRQAELERRGFAVIRFTWADLDGDAASVVAVLRRLLGDAENPWTRRDAPVTLVGSSPARSKGGEDAGHARKARPSHDGRGARHGPGDRADRGAGGRVLPVGAR